MVAPLYLDTSAVLRAVLEGLELVTADARLLDAVSSA
jgi:predicted nucleic acid-binding protein